jgi:hypothetical protein
MAASGERLVATATRFNRVDASGSTTSTGYTSTLSAGGKCGIDFVAPPSGIVTVLFKAVGFNSGANENKTAIRVGQGATVDAGTQVYAPNDNDMILSGIANVYGIPGWAHVPSLVAGDTYNVCLYHKVSAGTGTYLYRMVKVLPDV